MREEEPMSAWCLGEQRAAAAPWPLPGWQEASPWPLGRLQGQWVAEAPRPLHCLLLQVVQQVGPHLFLG